MLAALLAPDLDALPALLSGEPITGFHNRGSHSLLAAAILAIPFTLICSLLAGGNWKFFWLIGFLAGLSHVVIDALTFGRGVQLLWPFTDARYGGHFYVLYGVRHSVKAPLGSHVLTVVNDLAFAALLWMTVHWTQHRKRHRLRAHGEAGQIDTHAPTMKVVPPAD